MSKIIFNSGTECEISSASRTTNLIKLFGEEIPQDASGFVLIRDFNDKPLNFEDFTTVYRVEDDGVTFSNNESEYVKESVVKVIWDDSDDYDHIRPEEVTVTVKKNGFAFKTENLSAANDWKATYEDSVIIPIYTVEGNEIEGYEASISGSTITYKHEADIPVPPVPPTTDLEERVSELETDMRNLNYVIGGEVG